MVKHQPEEMRRRVNLFMSKLSDRDTAAMAAAELDSIARNLAADDLPLFVSAVGDARPTDKTPLRRHSLRLLSLLAHSFPPAAIAPHLPRIVSAALRRLRDPDSSVRTALVAVVRSLATASPPSAVIPSVLRPLADALFHEQDLNPQSVSAFSLAAALDEIAAASGGGDPDLTGFLHRILPRLVKLVRSPSFKSKTAILTLLGSAVAAGGISGDTTLQAVVHCLAEFLAGEDWSARKAAAEALTRVAGAEKDRLFEFKSYYLALFEARRYDKVKIVRDSINRMMEVWNEIPDREPNHSEFRPNSLKDENVTDGKFPNSSTKSSSLEARRRRKLNSRSPAPTKSPIPSSAKKIVHPSRTLNLNPNSASSRRISRANTSDWKIEISVPDAGFMEKGRKNGEEGRTNENGDGRSKIEARRVLFEKNCEEKKMDEMKPGIRVAPLQENASLEVATGEDCDELIEEQKYSDLSLIRMQLVQIEKQQSNLLELLQKFMGSSWNGINSLEARVNSLEMTLDEISRDFVVSSSRVCCINSKFRRRADGRFTSRLANDVNDFGDRDGRKGYPCNKQKFGFANPFAESLQFNPRRLLEKERGDAGSKFVL